MSEKTDQPNRGIYKNIPSWYLYMVLAILVVIVILVRIIFPPHPRRANKIICMANLKVLRIAMQIYADDYNGMYPTPEKWCDLLVSFSGVEPKQFICRGSDSKIGESSYCLNKNIAGKKFSEISPDTVLLFETKEGWNQVGGPEILTLENHKGEGCNFLFNDGHVEFVKAERLGELKWDIEKQDNESME